MVKTNWKNKKAILEDKILNQCLSYEEIGRQYNCSGGNIKKVAQRLGIMIKPRRRVSQSELARLTTRKLLKKDESEYSICLNCGKKFIPNHSSYGKFCSNACCGEYRYKENVHQWQNGKISGTNGYSCASFVRKYLLKKNNYKCQICGWGKINPYTNLVPLQIHHIDGNSLNNSESNLQVLCPNCHALTENFGSRNKNAPRGKSKYYNKAKRD